MAAELGLLGFRGWELGFRILGFGFFFLSQITDLELCSGDPKDGEILSMLWVPP